MSAGQPKKVIVAFGFPGCGKTTMLKTFVAQNPHYAFFDIFNYILPYKKEDGSITVEEKKKAHEELLATIEQLERGQKLVVEFSTNHPEMVVPKLGSLAKAHNVLLVFCSLDKDICIQRALTRAAANKDRIFPSREYLEEKFKRPYPALHQKLAEEHGLTFHHFDMNNTPENLVLQFSKLVQS